MTAAAPNLHILSCLTDKEAESTLLESLAHLGKVSVAGTEHLLSGAEIPPICDFIYLDLTSISEGASMYQGNMQVYLGELRKKFPRCGFIVCGRKDEIRSLVKIVRDGADDYLPLPFQKDELLHVQSELLLSIRDKGELHYLRDESWEEDADTSAVSRNLRMRDAITNAKAVAPTDSTVLVTGDTGTGKSLIAQLIHRHSSREKSQFITVNCGAVPADLLENELFGHEKGAYTGAATRSAGKIELARGGTLFLDEIGTLALPMQVKLLQVLQDKTFYRLGGTELIKADVRIVSATNEDLIDLQARGLFRKDLFYRLSVFPIALPSLKDRPEDIPYLVELLTERLAHKLGREIVGIHPIVMDAFVCYPWPGNVRELENVLERAIILESSNYITATSVPTDFFTTAMDPGPIIAGDEPLPDIQSARQRATDAFERQYLIDLLQEYRGRIDRSARHAGLTTRQLRNLMRKHQLFKEDFKESLEMAPLSISGIQASVKDDILRK